MQAQQDYSKQALEVYHQIRSGKVKELPNVSKDVMKKITEKLPKEQKDLFAKIDTRSVNAFIKLAKTTDEKNFIKALNDPESVALKLTAAEMEALAGGARWGLAIIGCASMVAVIGSFGLSAGGCAAGAMIYNGLYP